MEINCISCGHRIEVGDAYDNYQGPMRCWVCGARLAVKIDSGCVRAISTASGLACSPAQEVPVAPPVSATE